MDFSTTPHGCLPEGTKTLLGVIEQVSLTAYLIEGRWVAFEKVHGQRPVAEPLVRFVDYLPR
jgi:hypothetical protein